MKPLLAAILIVLAGAARASSGLPLIVEARDRHCALEISGDLTGELVGRLRQALDEHPSIRAVVLNSAGGNAVTITQSADLLRERGVKIAAMHGQCDSACAFLWVAAPERYVISLRPGVGAGFHAPQFEVPWLGTRRALYQEWQQREYLQAVGLPASFIGWAYAPVDGFWRPDPEQLSRIGVRTGRIAALRAGDVSFCGAVPRSRKA